MMEQQQFKGEGFEITPELIFSNKEVVVDFFGDHRDQWYKVLLGGGQTFLRTSFDSQSPYEGNDNDLPPLDPIRMTEVRAEQVIKFFKEYPKALEDFLNYRATYTNSKTTQQ